MGLSKSVKFIWNHNVDIDKGEQSSKKGYTVFSFFTKWPRDQPGT